MTNIIPQSIDYTNRDYFSIRNALISAINSKFEGTEYQWAGDDPADFGLALVEAFAMMGDTINYYIDRIANENYITTATQRQSILNLASNFGYRVSGYRSATSTFSLKNNYQVNSASLTSAVVSGTNITYSGSNSFSQGQVVSVTLSVGDLSLQVNDAVITGVTPSSPGSLINSSFTIYKAGVTAGTYSITGTATVSNTITLPSGTQFALSVPNGEYLQTLYFSSVTDVTLQAQGTQTVNVIQGRYASSLASNDSTYGEVLTTNASGYASQSYALGSRQVVDGTTKVYVAKGNIYKLWSEVTTLLDWGPTDLVYTTFLDADDITYIQFGDGVSGAIPTATSTIKVDYLIGDGTLGNIPATPATLNGNTYKPYVQYIPGIGGIGTAQAGAISSYTNVTNLTQATGGAGPESNDSIRANAPSALRALNRAVTLQDYANLAVTVANVGKANAVATSPNSVTVYIAPQSDDVTDLTPGVVSGTPTTALSTLITTVDEFLTDKSQIGASVTVSQPTYVGAFVDIKYTKSPKYNDADVQLAIRTALFSAFSYNKVDFEAVITANAIEQVLIALEGVNTVKVTGLGRTHVDGSINTLIGSPNELFVFSDSFNGAQTTFLSAYTSTSNLTGLTVVGSGTGSLSGFSGSFYNYNLSLTGTTASVTPTLSTASKIVISYNGIAVNGTSGSATTITLVSGTYPLLISVVADDGFSTSIYTVNITK